MLRSAVIISVRVDFGLSLLELLLISNSSLARLGVFSEITVWFMTLNDTASPYFLAVASQLVCYFQSSWQKIDYCLTRF